jgi:hypothetical protein
LDEPLIPIAVVDRAGAICREVIESLPQWFGIAASNEAVIAATSGADVVRGSIGAGTIWVRVMF